MPRSRAHSVWTAESEDYLGVDGSGLHEDDRDGCRRVVLVGNGRHGNLTDTIERSRKARVFKVVVPWLAVVAPGGMGVRAAYWFTLDYHVSAEQDAEVYAGFALRILTADSKRIEPSRQCVWTHCAIVEPCPTNGNAATGENMSLDFLIGSIRRTTASA